MHDYSKSLDDAIRKNKQDQMKLERGSKHSDVILGILTFLELACLSLLCCMLYLHGNTSMLIFFILLIPDALIGVCASLFMIYKDNRYYQALNSDSDD